MSARRKVIMNNFQEPSMEGKGGEKHRQLLKTDSVADFCYTPEPNEAWSRQDL